MGLANWLTTLRILLIPVFVTLLVYRRAGRPCLRCGGQVRSRPQGDAARVAYWCPGCQR